ncbi:glycosyltransferase [Nocardioides sp. HDW12B]|nr:glycosyltransferase [Nocardioides sp. HDW12B]
MLVVVPARNEEADLGACLTSVDRAVARVRRARPASAVRVVVVLDSCTDRTAEVLHRFPHVARLDVRLGLVGAARAAGILAARTHDLDHPAERTWLACTDADGQVPADWLTGQLDHADRGACAVVGTVEPDHDLPAPVRARWLAHHATHEGHTHVHGANLGVRLDQYDAVGGFEPLAEHEDVRLVERLVAAGGLLVRTGDGRVTTSSRRVGRTPGGFAAYLGVLHDLHDLHDPRDPGVSVAEVDDRAVG